MEQAIHERYNNTILREARQRCDIAPGNCREPGGFDVNNLDDNPWVAAFMNGRKERLENDLPYLTMDFASFSQ